MATKLPVLYVPGCLPWDLRDRGVFRLASWTVRATTEDEAKHDALVKYTAANYCRTCRFFQPGIAAWCERLERNVKQDGKWFCGDHEEKENA